EVIANRAERDLVFDLKQRMRKITHLILRSPQYIKSQPLGRLLPDARQPFEFVDQFCDRFRVIKHLHHSRRQHSTKFPFERFLDLSAGFVEGGKREVLDHLDIAVFDEIWRDLKLYDFK